MISADIEKEIQQENKVVLGLSLRKAIILGAGIVVTILLVLLMGFDVALYPIIPVAGISLFFGWYTKDGLNAERYLMKKLQEKYYKNNKRAYRTKNRYISLMNTEYKRHKNKDMADKKIAKAVKKEIKANRKRVQKSSLKAIN